MPCNGTAATATCACSTPTTTAAKTSVDGWLGSWRIHHAASLTLLAVALFQAVLVRSPRPAYSGSDNESDNVTLRTHARRSRLSDQGVADAHGQLWRRYIAEVRRSLRNSQRPTGRETNEALDVLGERWECTRSEAMRRAVKERARKEGIA